MTDLSGIRRSAVDSCLEQLNPVWQVRDFRKIALHFGDPSAEIVTGKVLGLADRSLLPRIGLKGPDAVSWAREFGINVPQEIFGWNRAGDDSLAVRLGIGEIFLEGKHVKDVEKAAAHGITDGDCFPVRREDAGFLLTGRRALEVLAQTCSYNFRSTEKNLIMTRVARVSCSILVREVKMAADLVRLPVYHLWTAASYGPFLWKELIAIVQDCTGGPVGDEAVNTLLATG